MSKSDIIITTISALVCVWALISWALPAFGIEPAWLEGLNFWRMCVGG
jgi:hypothetical protein